MPLSCKHVPTLNGTWFKITQRENPMKFIKFFILTGILIFNGPIQAAEEANQLPGPTTGTVAETMQAGGYSYIRVEEQGIWMATAVIPVSEGDQVQYSGGMEMRDFYSKSLDRTFESIFFIQNVSLVGQDVDAMHAAAMEGHDKKDMQIPKPVTVDSPVSGEITPLKEGKTIADIFTHSAQLNEQEVSLNAKVIKVSKNIVGKNWITLQDGTGTEPDNKLLATSQELVSPGDMVIARGIVRTDRDIGSGYKYKVLMEEVTFSPGFK
jgi:hypothetical protein